MKKIITPIVALFIMTILSVQVAKAQLNKTEQSRSRVPTNSGTDRSAENKQKAAQAAAQRAATQRQNNNNNKKRGSASNSDLHPFGPGSIR